ncbi:MAG: hypothetical protein FP824_01870 [Euryarchaeota archaeon]|nr:hypothetical protein [Euryarchaeota archaeon]MBU4033146.1 V-type ATP synthase subunit E [Candidatus Thermoplasmatota archaeon]MBU4072073.1 V-type ATP synthase subunit E [Candidatus Thermoplasmatota archaeon]MBU4143383.1 V-type ATP synthase subunit E [Candidatus Thermoplasmatota archaeon]
MSLDEVKRKIIDLANEKACEIREEAAGHSSESERKYDDNIKKMLDSGRRRYIEGAKLQKERRMGVARVEARNRHLNAKQEIINEVIDEALSRILALSDEEYLGIMERLFAAANLPECECEVQISQADAKRITVEFLKSVEKQFSKDGKKVIFTLSKTQREDIRGGFVVKVGQIEMDCSLGTLIRMRRGELEREAAQILFGGQDAA